jgi:hypothetical protein
MAKCVSMGGGGRGFTITKVSTRIGWVMCTLTRAFTIARVLRGT